MRRSVIRYSTRPGSVNRIVTRPIKPQPAPATPQPANGESKSHIGKWGLLFGLGGLALASWLAKPTQRAPTAAFDRFKPSVAVVFIFGPSGSAAKQFCDAHGFGYVPEPTAAAVDSVVSKGYSKIIVANCDAKSLEDFEKSTVACDVALNYTKENLPALEKSRRLINMDGQTIESVLQDRNLI